MVLVPNWFPMLELAAPLVVMFIAILGLLCGVAMLVRYAYWAESAS